jgi:serine/threonine protein phosphatase PrpC
MSGVELHHGAATDVGLVREVNEDAYLVAPPVFVVADGMGGHDRGDVAAAIVVEEFARLADGGYDVRRGPEVVAETLRAAQTRIATYDAEQRAAGARDFAAGTTAVVALLIEEGGEPKWLLANLGDSRVYRLLDGVVEQVSVDHSVVQELVEAGVITPDDAAVHPERHIITRALGGRGSVEADYYVLPLSGAERLLLCSDGVSGMIDDEQIGAILAAASDPRDAADRLVAAAVAAGGRDNATAVVVDVVGLADDRPYDSDAQRVSLEQKLGARP